MMRMTLAMIALLLAAASQAQTLATAELVSDPFFESYQPEVAVSGNVIVGVMTGASAAALAGDGIAIDVPEGTAPGSVCLRVASRDGIYLSRNEYRYPAGDASVRLPYRSGMRDVIAGYGDGELAMSAAAGGCEEPQSRYYLLRANDEKPATVLVYVNSFGATDVFFQTHSFEESSDVAACEYISEGRRTTFDFYCEVPWPPDAQELGVTLLRERFGREQPAIEFTVAGPARVDERG